MSSSVVVLCLFWYVVSTTGNLLTKSVLADFPHPMTLTLVQLTMINLLSRPVFNLWGARTGNSGEVIGWGRYFKFIVPLALGKFLGNVLNHVSIWKVPVSYTNTVRATMPLFTVVLSRLMLREHQTGKIYLSLVPIVGGVAIATLTELSFNFIGLLSALASTMTFSLQNIYSKKVLRDTGIHHLNLLLIIGQLSLLLFLPIWLMYDAQSVWHDLTNSAAVKISYRTIALLLLDGVVNWLHGIAVFSVMFRVTPLTFAVANACKLIFVIAVTLFIIGNPVTNTNIFGIVVAISGVLCYNKAKYDQRQVMKKDEVSK